MASTVIVCGGCGASFRMDHGLFRDARGARIRCRKCGERIVVWNPAASPALPAPEAPATVPPRTPEPAPSPPGEQAISPVSAGIEAEPEIAPAAATEPERVAAAEIEPEPITEAEIEPVAEAAPEFAVEAELEFLAEPEPAPAAATNGPADVETLVKAPVEAQATVPAFKPGGFLLEEEEPAHAQPAAWMEAVPPRHAPEAVPTGEPEASVASPGHHRRWDIRLEELLFPKGITREASKSESPLKDREAELAALKRRFRASRRRGRFRFAIFLVVPIILLLAGGAYFFHDTKLARELAGRLFPPPGPAKTASPAGPASPASPVTDGEKPAYDIRDMDSSYMKAYDGLNLFVIRGTVANVGKGPSRGIRVQAALLGKDNQALASNTVFAGNVVDNTALRHAKREVVEGFLGVRYGEGNVNREIPAGKSLPFMVVFFDPPGPVESYSVKAQDAE